LRCESYPPLAYAFLIDIARKLAAVEAAAEEEAASVKERARIESVRLKRNYLRHEDSGDSLASQVIAIGSTADKDGRDNHSLPRESPDVEMTDDFSFGSEDNHTTIQLQSDRLITRDAQNGRSARADAGHNSTHPHDILRGGMQTPKGRSENIEHSTASTPSSDRMSTSPQRPHLPPPAHNVRSPAQAELSVGAGTPYKNRETIPLKDRDGFCCNTKAQRHSSEGSLSEKGGCEMCKRCIGQPARI